MIGYRSYLRDNQPRSGFREKVYALWIPSLSEKSVV